MSDTPRTDRRIITQQPKMCGCSYSCEIINADFARQLERELNTAKQELQAAVKRMEDVSVHKLEDLFMEHVTDWTQGIEAVRARLIQAAKGEQP